MGSKIDETGHIYGKLTVIKEDPIRASNGNIRWICQCECGNTTSVQGSDLRRGKITSCGCSHRLQLEGKRFGKLVALHPSGHTEQGLVIWHCKCDCGNECDARGYDLQRGHTTSCGCARKRDLTNRRFGKLVAIKPTGEKNSQGAHIWKCKCDCGTELEVNAKDLLRGHRKSCGCLTSIAEVSIRQWLQDNEISYIDEYSFPDLRYKYPLRFDFYIPTANNNFFLIEYQGSQHYDNSDFGKQQREITDKMKQEYCKKHGIRLEEIRFDEDIEARLKEIFNITE